MFTSGFFNADKKGDEWDRSYKAEFFARYFASFIGDGVYPNPGTCMQVISIDNDMRIRIQAGQAWIKGYYAENTDDYSITLTPADGAFSRIDRVVLRLDFLDREIVPIVKQGEYASTPTAQTLQRDADAYEIAIADIIVSRGAIKINQSNITDLRLNSSLCGIVHGTVEQVNTTEIFNQYEAWFQENKIIHENDFEVWMNEFKLSTGKKFTDWVNDLKNSLDPNEDIAAQLQMQITENKQELVSQKAEIESLHKFIRNVTIPITGWVKDTTIKVYKYKLLDEDITADTVVDVNVKVAYLEKAEEFKTATESFNGYVEIYSESIPTESILCDLVLTNHRGVGGGGGNGDSGIKVSPTMGLKIQ